MYINLLEAETYQYYYKSPQALRGQLQANENIKIVIIDEIQKIPILLDEVHALIESLGYVNFILCGSSARRLKSTGANLLGGRAWRYLFQPLCYPELKVLDWKKIFNHGLIPSHYLAKSQITKFLASYLYDYILPEVQYEANIRNRESFSSFMNVIGSTNAEIINYSNIARDCGIDSKTVKAYFEILEDMYLGYQIYPLKSSQKRQIITASSKFYLFDTGLANYLRGYTYQNMLGVDAGKSFEHYFFLELIAYKNLCEKRDAIHYWRTKEGYEVDFIIQNLAFEIQITDNVQKKHCKGLIEFSKEHSHKLNIVCFEPRRRIISIGDTEIMVWPIEEFLENLWAHKVWC